jgi:hypothetical protein
MMLYIHKHVGVILSTLQLILICLLLLMSNRHRKGHTMTFQLYWWRKNTGAFRAAADMKHLILLTSILNIENPTYFHCIH